MPATGSAQMRSVATSCRAAGPRMRRTLATRLRAAAEPIKRDTQANANSINSPRSNLGGALAAATRVTVATGRNVAVRVIVDGKRMPQGMQGLPQAVEGETSWNHPVWGHRDRWVNGEKPHPILGPAIPGNLGGVLAAVDSTLAQTASELAKG